MSPLIFYLQSRDTPYFMLILTLDVSHVILNMHEVEADDAEAAETVGPYRTTDNINHFSVDVLYQIS